MTSFPEGVRPVARLSGGEISEVWRVDADGIPAVLKLQHDAPEGFFEAEEDGLRRLRAAGGLRVPQVLARAERHLLLEWLPPQRPVDPALFARRFARGLADQHRVVGAAFGLERDNFLGLQPQSNAPTARWPAFYRDRRLLPQIERADRTGRLAGGRRAAALRVVDALESLLDGLPDPPSLLHGDLWSGNFLCTLGDIPALIDPAVHHGPREMELAYVELFGGFPHGFVDAYRDAWPLDPGYERRRPLHQLYPLLIHLNHFGEAYGPAVDAACRDALAAGGIVP